MRSLRTGLRVIAVGAVTVAVGIAVNQVLNVGRWSLRWLVAAFVLASLAEGVDVWLGTRDKGPSQDRTPKPVLWPSLTGENGMPLRLREVTPTDLGVQPSRFSAEGNSPYIRRQADDLLADVLPDDAKRLVIAVGPRLAGTTRTLAQAAKVHLLDHLVAGFIDDPRVPLGDMITQAARWAADTHSDVPGVVLWLDGLSPSRFVELARVPLGDLPVGVRVLSTVDSGELEGLRIPGQLDQLLSQHSVRIQLTAITEQERRDLRAQEVYAALRPVLDQQQDLFLGRIMVAWKPLREALTRGGSEQATDRVALLHAVTDWYRVHLPRLLNADVLGYMYRAYRAELTSADPGSPVSAAGFDDALQWATAAPTADRPRLIDRQHVSGGQRYAPYPLLSVIADDPAEDASWPVSNALWSYADRYFEGDQRRDIGYSALARGACQAAARLLSHADAAVEPDAYNRIASLFYERGDKAASRDWWCKTVDTGDPDHAPTAMVSLGNLDEDQGDVDQARHWYQQAIGTGHSEVAPRAMHSLGNLEKDQGDVDQARHWYQQAIGTGHSGAMVSLGHLEREHGDLDQARHWYQQAIATGHSLEAPLAMANLGYLEWEQQNLGEARHWYQQAFSTGHPLAVPTATYGLGVLEYDQDNIDEARHWFQQAILTGMPPVMSPAMGSLGRLEQDHGDLQLARYWYQQGIATGHPDTAPKLMVSLGILEHGQGDLVRSRHWYQRAISTGHSYAAATAMFNLGTLEGEQGHLDQARHWYQLAISTGQPRVVDLAQQQLRDLDRHEDERLRGERFGQYRYLAYADGDLMDRREENLDPSDTDVLKQAPDGNDDGPIS